MQWELVLFRAVRLILVGAFPFARLLWCCSSEDFEGGQIVPEAAPGAVTTTGQLLQSTGPLLGNVIKTHAIGNTQRWQHTHTHAHTNWHCQTRWHAAHSRAQEDIPLPAVWHVQVSVIRTSRDCCGGIIRSDGESNCRHSVCLLMQFTVLKTASVASSLALILSFNVFSNDLWRNAGISSPLLTSTYAALLTHRNTHVSVLKRGLDTPVLFFFCRMYKNCRF